MKYGKIVLIASSVLVLSACTKLNEKLNSETTTPPGGSGGGSGNVAALLKSAYASLQNPFEDQSRFWAASTHTTDECIGPTRGGDWDDNGVWRVLHNHKWDADHGFLTDTYRELLQAQFACTAVLDNNPSPQQAAEAKFLRALVMWAVLDGWDQVPFRSTTLGDLTQSLPETKSGAACADFLIAELNAALPNLPAGPASVANKDAARALLMKLYLNKGVYANRANPTFAAADMNQVITLADQILNNGSYTLAANYFGNFAPNNDAIGTENVFTLYCDNAAGFGGNNQSRWFMGLHYNQNPSGWNGFTTLGDFYDKFEAADKRRGGGAGPTVDAGYYPGVSNVTGLHVGFLFGQQKNQAGTNQQDRKGNPLSFTKEVKLKETGNNLEITGIRVVKYVPDLAHQFPADNDYVIFRVTDVALMKAEAILRGGTATSAGPWGSSPLAIVNYIRTNASRAATSLPSIDLNGLLDERGRELYYEGWRRNDLIRFGKYLGAWQEKPATTAERLLFPIPNQQLSINPNLRQNPGY